MSDTIQPSVNKERSNAAPQAKDISEGEAAGHKPSSSPAAAAPADRLVRNLREMAKYIIESGYVFSVVGESAAWWNMNLKKGF